MPSVLSLSLTILTLYLCPRCHNHASSLLPTNCIKVDGNKDSIYKYLHYAKLKLASIQFQESFLDVLYVLLRTDIYDVVRFKCHNEADARKYDLNHTMLRLLEDCIKTNAPLQITKRVIHLVGLVGKAGFSATDLKKYLGIAAMLNTHTLILAYTHTLNTLMLPLILLEFLKTPSEVSVSLLQAFRLMFREDQGISKVSDSSSVCLILLLDSTLYKPFYTPDIYPLYPFHQYPLPSPPITLYRLRPLPSSRSLAKGPASSPIYSPFPSLESINSVHGFESRASTP